jgi:hypothetical protein
MTTAQSYQVTVEGWEGKGSMISYYKLLMISGSNI